MVFIKASPEFIRSQLFKRAIWWYAASVVVICLGFILAAREYPGGFDWFYTVASALASHKHNPAGSFWFAGSLGISMLLLWGYISSIKQNLMAMLPAAGFSIRSVRIGLLFGFILGIERLFIYDLSHWIHKAHEGIALVSLSGLYIGILSLLIQLMQRKKCKLIPVLIIVTPLIATGISGLWLYVVQHDIGWVNINWRDKGIPVGLSFAFWQWLAIGLLWAGMGMLYHYSNKNNINEIRSCD